MFANTRPSRKGFGCQTPCWNSNGPARLCKPRRPDYYVGLAFCEPCRAQVGRGRGFAADQTGWSAQVQTGLLRLVMAENEAAVAEQEQEFEYPIRIEDAGPGTKK